MWPSTKLALAHYATLLPSIFTLLNTSIGVIALAMPYCFHQPTHGLRVVILLLFTAVITPLCLVRRVQYFSRLSTFAMFFYSLILIHMTFALAVPRLVSDPLCLSKINWWRPAGVPSCLPIMFGAIFCQPQIPTIYASLRQPSVEAIRDVVRFSVAVILVTYGLFGFFGCIAFAGAKTMLGNVFLMYPNDLMSFAVQTGFLLTIIVSIPLTLFPLRQSIHTFLFHKTPSQLCQLPPLEHNDGLTVPPGRFRLITNCVLAICFTFSLTTDKNVCIQTTVEVGQTALVLAYPFRYLLPSVEVIIKLTSSLAGSMIGYILPALVLLPTAIGNSSKTPGLPPSRERRVSLLLLLLGCLLMFLGLFPIHVSPDTPQVTLLPLPDRPVMAGLAPAPLKFPSPLAAAVVAPVVVEPVHPVAEAPVPPVLSEEPGEAKVALPIPAQVNADRKPVLGPQQIAAPGEKVAIPSAPRPGEGVRGPALKQSDAQVAPPVVHRSLKMVEKLQVSVKVDRLPPPAA